MEQVKRLLSMVLALTLLVSCLPMGALAEEIDLPEAALIESENQTEAPEVPEPEEPAEVEPEETEEPTIIDSGTCGDNVTWTLDSEGLLTISGTGEMDDYVKTPYLEYVQTPWNNEKHRNHVRTVIIQPGVTSIGWYAFYGCTSLTSISIPDGVISIGYSSFTGCTSLTSINLPNSVTSIGWYAFSDCTSLTSISIPDGVTSIGESVFSGCTSLTSINLPNSVTSIGHFSFAGCTSLTGINLPNSVTSIGSRAFDGCTSLTSINLPNSVTSIGYLSFGGCSNLTSINIPDGVTSIGWDAFSGCTSLTSITIPDGVTSIEAGTFSDCTSLTSINLPDGVTSIGWDAFYGCTSLTSITIPDGVTSIGVDAFVGCTSLTSISIPDGVTSIGQHAFFGCTSLTSIDIPNGVTSIERGTFEDCSSLTSVTLPDSVTSIGEEAFWGCSSLTSISIPDSVTSIGDSAFTWCSSLTSISIPDSVTSIEGSTFGNCYSLTSIVIPDSVTSIGDGAFGGCTSLTSISIPDGVTSIGQHAFDGCDRLTSISIPDSVTSIEEAVFWSCDSLTNITIPDSVTSIEEAAFTYCDSLKAIHYGGDEDDWKRIVIGRYNSSIKDAHGKDYKCYDDDCHHAIIYYNSAPQGALSPEAEKLELTKAIYSYGSKQVDLLTNAHSVDNTHAAFTLECAVKDPSKAIKYELYSGLKKIAESKDGVFEDVSPAAFHVNQKTYVLVSGKTTSTRCRINLTVSEPKVNITYFSLANKNDEKISVTLPEGFPVLGSTKFSLKLPELPVSCVWENGVLKVGINVLKTALYDSNSNGEKTTGKKTFAQKFEKWKTDLKENTAKSKDIVKDMGGYLRSDDVKTDIPGITEKVTFTVVGYGEVKWSDSLEKMNVTILVITSYKGTRTFQLIEVPVTLVIDSKLEGELAASGGYDFIKSEWFGNANLNLNVEASAYVGAGAGTWVSAGIYGKAGVKTAIVVLSTNSRTGLDKVTMTSTLGLKAYFAKIEVVDKPLLSVADLRKSKTYGRYVSGSEFMLYSRSSQSLVGDLLNQNGIKSAVLPAPNAAPQEVTETAELVWHQAAPAVTTLAAYDPTMVVDNAYPGAQPLLSSDGSLAVYLEEQTDRTVLRYFTDTASGVVDDDNTADFNPVLVQDGTDTYIAYQDSRRSFSASAAPSAGEYLGSFGVSVAKYDPAAQSFTDLGSPDNNGVYCYGQSLTATPEGLLAVWAENSGNDIFGQKGENSIWYSVYRNGWSVPVCAVRNVGVLTSLTVGKLNGKTTIAYAVDVDGDLHTASQYLYLLNLGGSPVLAGEGEYSQLQFNSLPGVSGTALTLNQQGGLSALTSASGSPQIILPEGTMDNGGSYQVAGNRIYYLKTQNETRSLCTAVYEGGSWGSVELISSEDYVDSFSVGGSRAIYLLTSAQFDSNDELTTRSAIKLLLDTDRSEVSLNYIDFDEDEVVPGGTLPVSLSLTNKGTATVRSLTLTVDGSSIPLEGSLLPGETKTLTAKVPLPADLTGRVLKLTLDPSGDTAELDVSRTDLSVEAGYRVDGETGVEAVVTNQSGVPANGEVVFTDGEGAELLRQTVSLNSYENTTVTLPLTEEMIPAEGETVYTVTVTTGQEEYYQGNNSATVPVWKVGDTTPTEVELPTTAGYTIAYKGNGGSGSVPSLNVQVDQTAALAVNGFENPGYHFVQWNTKADGTGTGYDESQTVTGLASGGTVTLYAIWEINRWQVTLDGVEEPIFVTYGQPYGELPDLRQEGLVFRGWFTEPEGGSKITATTLVTVDEDHTLYPQWSQQQTLPLPTPSQPSGEVERGTVIDLTCSMPGAQIWASVNGGEFTLWTEELEIAGDTQLTVYASLSGYKDSPMLRLNYTLVDPAEDWGDILEDDRGNFASAEDVPDRVWLAGVPESVDYCGAAVTFPDLRVYSGKQLLTSGVDYTVKYANNTKVSTEKTRAKVIVTGKGSFTGSQAVEFDIIPYSIYGLEVAGLTANENGKVQKPSPVVTAEVGGKTVTLKKGTDYVLYYPTAEKNSPDYNPDGFKVPGVHVIQIVGKGNYSGVTSCELTLLEKSYINISKATVGKLPTLVYSGEEQTPAVTLTYSKTPLEEGVDYEVTYKNNVEVGTASVVISGKGDFFGSVTKTFKITGVALSKAKIEGLVVKETYTGEQILGAENAKLYIAATKTTPQIDLVEGVDYTVAYTNNVKAGSATVTFTGMGGYTGTVKKTFTIAPTTAFEVEPLDAQTYTKGGVKPLPVVKFGDTVLTNGVDYTLTYKNNTKVADLTVKSVPTVTVKGKGNFSGSVAMTFEIVPSSLDNVTATATDIVFSNKANICKPTITVLDSNGTKLASGTDYDKVVTYAYASATTVTQMVNKVSVEIQRKAGDPVDTKDIIPAGAVVKATLTGKGNYADSTLTVPFRFVQGSLAKATVKITAQTYTGRPIRLKKSDITVKIGKVELSPADYEIVGYKNNTAKGTAKVTLRGIGNYGGTKEVSFTISARKMN